MYPFILDLPLSLRSLRRSPGFVTIAVLTLVLGIAGNIVVFTIINATLLRPLPYPEPSHLFVLHWQEQGDLSASAFFLLENRFHSFSSVTALRPLSVGINVSAAGPPEYVRALPVSQEFFQTLGVKPELGRPFRAEDVQPNAARAAILSYRLWMQVFDRDPSALGHNLLANGQTYTIIGIMPREFRSYPDADIWLPLQLKPGNTDLGNDYRVVGRLAPGMSQQQAQYELEGLAREYHSIYPYSAPLGRIVLQPLQSFVVNRERQGLGILFVAVAFVFLIACTNVAILILVRGAANTQAIAIRAALGPSWGRLVLSLLTESLLLSLAGGLLGLIAAKESLPLVLRLASMDFPRTASVSIDWHVVLFTVAIAIFSPLLFGLAPALRLSRVNLAQVLARTSRTASSSGQQVRAVRALVFCQMTLTVILLSGTMLMVRSLFNLYSVPLGFAPEHLFVAQLSLTGDKYRTTISTQHLLDQATKHLEASPGVDAIAALNGLPLEKSFNNSMRPVESPLVLGETDEYRPVTPGYFPALRIPLRSGRLFTPMDIAKSRPVAIVNEVAARRWWPNSSAIGHFIKPDEIVGAQFADVPREIVGVVADTHERGLGVPPPPTVFVPLAQTPDNITAFCNETFLTSLVVRTSGQIDLLTQVRNAVQSVDPTLPIASFQPFSEIVDHSLARQRFMALLTIGFSVFALVITGIGMHGLWNYQARLRTREIAIRIAVGASRAQILRTVVQQGARLISIAVFAGLVGSFIIKSFLQSLLYNVRSSSIVLILATGLLVGLVAMLISFLTAVRAASIEPMAVLRNE